MGNPGLDSCGSTDAELLNQVIEKSPSPGKYVATTVEALCEALLKGLSDLSKAISKDTSLSRRCEERGKRFYSVVQR